MKKPSVPEKDFEKTAVKVSNVSIFGNIVLTLFKLLAGIIAHSNAMISDAVHSASDVFSSVIVIVGVKLASKEADKEHPYGHERFEPVAAIVLAVILFITGLFIGYTAIGQLSAGFENGIEIPGVLALFAAFLSIVVKEAMYRYTARYAKALDSGALMADAWHHRSDALSSIGALIGIGGARLGYAWLDAAASLVICLFIVKASYDIFSNAIQKMVDHACDTETQDAIAAYVRAQEGVLGIGALQTREFGNRIYVDIEIYADGTLPLTESNAIAERVHEAIEAEFPKVKHIMVRVNPLLVK